jgi:hypothetical protein
MTRHTAYRELDDLLSGLEQNILSARDRDILSSKNADLIARTVRNIVNDRVGAKSTRETAALPDNAVERRRLLEVIAGARSGVPADVRIAYKGGLKISDQEVSELLNELVRRGYFKRSGR